MTRSNTPVVDARQSHLLAASPTVTLVLFSRSIRNPKALHTDSGVSSPLIANPSYVKRNEPGIISGSHYWTYTLLWRWLTSLHLQLFLKMMYECRTWKLSIYCWCSPQLRPATSGEWTPVSVGIWYLIAGSRRCDSKDWEVLNVLWPWNITRNIIFGFSSRGWSVWLWLGLDSISDYGNKFQMSHCP